jgi:hypothetical protein
VAFSPDGKTVLTGSADHTARITGGNVRQVREFSRHASVQTVLKYDHNRQDRAGQLAGRLADDMGPAA